MERKKKEPVRPSSITQNTEIFRDRATVKIVPVKEFSGFDPSGLKGWLSRKVPVQTSLAGSILKDSCDSCAMLNMLNHTIGYNPHPSAFQHCIAPIKQGVLPDTAGPCTQPWFSLACHPLVMPPIEFSNTLHCRSRNEGERLVVTKQESLPMQPHIIQIIITNSTISSSFHAM